MDASLVDRPAAPTVTPPDPGGEHAAPNGSHASGNGNGSPYGAMQPPPDPRRACRGCNATLAPGQEWCLQCGTGVPGSLARERDWRPLAALAAAGVLLLAGAGTAAYAALTQKPRKPPLHVLIAQVPAATTTVPPGGSTLNTPPATTPPATTPGARVPGAGTLGAGGTSAPKGTSTLGGPAATKPPRLPAVVPLPHTPTRSVLPPTNTGSAPTNETGTSSTPSAGAGAGGEAGSGESGGASTGPNPILLDTDAATDYNPSGYPESYFGDPALAIDGETSTAWTVQVEPKVAPRMAVGLALDFKTPRHLGTLEVHTSTPGETLEVFGAGGSKLPASITDPAWTKLSASHLVKRKIGTVKLASTGRAFRFLVLWLTRAPQSAVGTPTAPGRISIGEVVPYPPGK